MKKAKEISDYVRRNLLRKAKTLGEALKNMRERLGLEQRDVASRAGVSVDLIRALENETYPYSVGEDYVREIAEKGLNLAGKPSSSGRIIKLAHERKLGCHKSRSDLHKGRGKQKRQPRSDQQVVERHTPTVKSPATPQKVLDQLAKAREAKRQKQLERRKLSQGTLEVRPEMLSLLFCLESEIKIPSLQIGGRTLQLTQPLTVSRQKLQEMVGA